MRERRIYLFPALLPGLIAAQAVATIQVYLSNSELHRTLETIKGFGYLPVPNELVMPHLMGAAPAFWGGLFFTLSLGAGLSLLSLAAAWFWRRFSRQHRVLTAVYSILWMVLLIGVNRRGPDVAASCYFLFIPPLVFAAALVILPPPDQRSAGRGRWIPAASAVLLAVLWIPQMNRDFFGNVRDRLLFSNPIGRQFNQFYYDHTLHAAEVLKSLDQKTIKTCSLQQVDKAPVARALERALAAQDYLNIGGDGRPDLQVTEAANRFVLAHRATAVMEATLTELLSRTGPVVKEFSYKTDRRMFFRKAVYVSVLIGFPVLLYLLIFDLFHFGLGFFLAEKKALSAAALICFCLGAGLLVLFIIRGGDAAGKMPAARALQSEKLYDRVAALKTIEQKGLEIAGFAGYERLLSSPNVVERYWLVRTLGVSRQERTYPDLLRFLGDSQLNVAAMACYALGRRGDPRAVPVILERIRNSSRWYEQWYGYRALKAVGWEQTSR
jgi:hypothetical protein